MSLPTILAHGRGAAERRMQDTCTIRHPTGVVTGASGAVTQLAEVVYSGPCRVKQSGNGSATEGGEATVAVLSLEVHVPIDGTAAVVHSDIVTIDSALNEPALVGRTFRVTAKPIGSERTARRLACEEVD